MKSGTVNVGKRTMYGGFGVCRFAVKFQIEGAIAPAHQCVITSRFIKAIFDIGAVSGIANDDGEVVGIHLSSLHSFTLRMICLA